jgi:hypothetical protein
VQVTFPNPRSEADRQLCRRFGIAALGQQLTAAKFVIGFAPALIRGLVGGQAHGHGLLGVEHVQVRLPIVTHRVHELVDAYLDTF